MTGNGSVLLFGVIHGFLLCGEYREAQQTNDGRRTDYCRAQYWVPFVFTHFPLHKASPDPLAKKHCGQFERRPVIA